MAVAASASRVAMAGAPLACVVAQTEAGLVANHLPSGVKVFFQSENGLIGMLPLPEEGFAWADLTDGSLQNPIFRTETNVAPGSTDVWTNTTTAGNKVNNTEDCGNWTAGLLGLGREGRDNATNGDWTNTTLLDDSICSTKQRLYCFEQ